MSDGWTPKRAPLPHVPDAAADALAALPGLRGEVRALIEGTAGSSPYLAGLMLKEPSFTAELVTRDPGAVMGDVMGDVRGLGDDELGPGLRRAKGRVALLSALADLGGIWDLNQVTGALSDFAALAVDRALKASLVREVRRGRLPGMDEEDVQTTACGLAVIAMGKMGAGELNYSSDIDLICLFDETRYTPDDYQDARAGLIRATKAMAKLLSDITDQGYVFRTDLRLRPDPSVTPVCIAMEAAERYYESLGRTWERAAYIKARAAAGDIAAGEGFLKRLTPFVWRKYLDYAAIEDAQDMRLRIRAHKGTGGPIRLEGHDMKLGRGGIREIEFFTQTRQIIAGGREPKLRVRGTVAGLEALAAGGWEDGAVTQTLARDYTVYREIEHRLQMIADAQTHALPTSEDGFLRFARLMGTDDVDGLKRELQTRLHRVDEMAEPFFVPGAEDAQGTTEAAPAEHSDTIARWMRMPAMRSERARARFRRIAPMIFQRLEAAAQPSEALAAFEDFLSGLPAGVQLFALFEANPQLVELIIDIAATAPALATYLGRNAGVLDAVIGGSFFDDWPGVDALRDTIASEIGRAPDYEAKLDAARRVMKEWHFRVGVHHLRALIDAETAGRQYADLAEAVLSALWPAVVEEFARKHGDQPGRGACVLGMGSLGAGRLNAGSDLDLIVIYDDAGVEASDGARPLATRAYYARLTQALITALSAQMPEGRLYEADMRLRPSGRKGPVATAFSGFQTYQRDEAWGWEHLALTRARFVAGNAELGGEIEAFRRTLLGEVGACRDVTGVVRDMLGRMGEAFVRNSVWDVKNGPGGLREIEIFAQGAALVAGSKAQSTEAQLDALSALGWASEGDVARLRAGAGLMWQVVAAERLLIAGRFDVEAVGRAGRAFLLAQMSQPDIDTAATTVEKASAQAAEIINRVIGPQGEGDEKG